MEILLITGSPGAGKSTIAGALSEQLIAKNIAHAIIDVDDLAKTYPYQNPEFKWNNLLTLIPNYRKTNIKKLILPVVIEKAEDINKLKSVSQNAKIIICELKANKAVLIKRITKREPNDFWVSELKKRISEYELRQKIAPDIILDTTHTNVQEAVEELISKLNW